MMHTFSGLEEKTKPFCAQFCFVFFLNCNPQNVFLGHHLKIDLKHESN